mgnify:CR=1 FL=1
MSRKEKKFRARGMKGKTNVMYLVGSLLGTVMRVGFQDCETHDLEKKSREKTREWLK